MHAFIKNIFGATFALALLVGAVPAHAAELTSDQVHAVVSLLRSFGAESSVVDKVEAVLKAPSPSRRDGNEGHKNQMMASSTSSGGTWMPPGQVAKMRCIMLNRNLGFGSHGDDVKTLQELLAEDSENGFSSAPTGFFGPLTARALARFQERNNIASSTTGGTVGPLTRGFFERRCGKGLGQNEDHRGSMMQGVVTGIISANNGSSITVSQASKSRVVNFTASTTIQVFTGTSTTASSTVGSSADLIVGKPVMAEGTPNSDGSINARHIKVGIVISPARENNNE